MEATKLTFKQKNDQVKKAIATIKMTNQELTAAILAERAEAALVGAKQAPTKVCSAVLPPGGCLDNVDNKPDGAVVCAVPSGKCFRSIPGNNCFDKTAVSCLMDLAAVKAKKDADARAAAEASLVTDILRRDGNLQKCHTLQAGGCKESYNTEGARVCMDAQGICRQACGADGCGGRTVPHGCWSNEFKADECTPLRKKKEARCMKKAAVRCKSDKLEMLALAQLRVETREGVCFDVGGVQRCKKKFGDKCSIPEQCNSNVCSNGVCVAKQIGEHCEKREACGTGDCIGNKCTMIADGATCFKRDQDCVSDFCFTNASGASICEPVAGKGQACKGDKGCYSRRCLANGKCDGGSHDEMCISHDQCNSGVCASNKCVELASGSPCDADKLCRSGRCDGSVCKSKRVGEVCKTGEQCYSGLCTSGTCEEKATGGACRQNRECLSGLCAADNKCALRPNNADCALEPEKHPSVTDPRAFCVSGFCNSASKCKGLVGSTCAANNECALGNCAAGQCAYIAPGAACATDAQCSSSGVCDPTTKVCKVKRGEKCTGRTAMKHGETATHHCVFPNSCLADGKCNLQKVNSYCSTSSVCKSGKCDAWECVNGLGDSCSRDGECQSRKCGANGTCVVQTEGGRCLQTHLCQDSTCSLNSVGLHVCTKKPFGNACTEGKHCASGLCEAGAVREADGSESATPALCRAAPGESCTNSVDCGQNHVCSSAGKCVTHYATHGEHFKALGASVDAAGRVDYSQISEQWFRALPPKDEALVRPLGLLGRASAQAGETAAQACRSELHTACIALVDGHKLLPCDHTAVRRSRALCFSDVTRVVANGTSGDIICRESGKPACTSTNWGASRRFAGCEPQPASTDKMNAVYCTGDARLFALSKKQGEADGGECVFDTNCAGGSVCVGGLKCGKRANGGRCSSHANCASGLCLNGTCKAATGAACAASTDCATATDLCSGGKCSTHHATTEDYFKMANTTSQAATVAQLDAAVRDTTSGVAKYTIAPAGSTSNQMCRNQLEEKCISGLDAAGNKVACGSAGAVLAVCSSDVSKVQGRAGASGVNQCLLQNKEYCVGSGAERSTAKCTSLGEAVVFCKGDAALKALSQNGARKVGETCAKIHGNCQAGTCANNGTCVLSALGGSCDGAHACASGMCGREHKCVRQIGQACSTGADCIDGTCVTGVCTAKVGGAKCTGNSQCLSEKCTAGVCELGVGDRCTSSSQCGKGNCVNYTCQVVPDGGVCAVHRDCASNICNPRTLACEPPSALPQSVSGGLSITNDHLEKYAKSAATGIVEVPDTQFVTGTNPRTFSTITGGNTGHRMCTTTSSGGCVRAVLTTTAPATGYGGFGLPSRSQVYTCGDDATSASRSYEESGFSTSIKAFCYMPIDRIQSDGSKSATQVCKDNQYPECKAVESNGVRYPCTSNPPIAGTVLCTGDRTAMLADENRRRSLGGFPTCDSIDAEECTTGNAVRGAVGCMRVKVAGATGRACWKPCPAGGCAIGGGVMRPEGECYNTNATKCYRKLHGQP